VRKAVLYLLKLNSIDIPSFVKVGKVNFSILPPIKNNYKTIRGKKGIHFYNQTVGERIISVDISIIAEEGSNPMKKTRQLAEWLYHEEAVKLVINDEPDKYYMVLPDGETSISEVVSVGQGTISFLCTEPFAFGEEKELLFPEVAEEPVYFNVEGNTDTHSQIELTIKEDTPFISVASDNGLILLGNPTTVDETPKNPKPDIFVDDMSNTSLWTSATSVESGSIAGSFTSNGYSFQVNDYGTGSGWHGPSAIRSLSKPVQDFEVRIALGFITTHANQLGLLECYLLDSNNENFGKIGMVDGSSTYTNRTFNARAGKQAGGQSFIHETRQDVWRRLEGMLIIRRRGNEWLAYIGDKGDYPYYHSRLVRRWIDTEGIAMNPLSKIQIRMAAYGSTDVINTMYISDIKVSEYVELTSNQTPIIAGKDDVILIDNERSIVYKNGEAFYEGLNPVSNFFGLQKGVNGLAVSPAGTDMKVTYKERWL
jgi:predicted phage tail component-like protein